MLERHPSSSPREVPFIWSTGIEDTFITTPHPDTGRILDEYALTEHYERWEQDIALAASLGVPAVRYGIPWHRVCPRPGEYDWSWIEPVLTTIVERHKITPIVDLVHYATPSWLEGSFASPDYPKYVSEYAFEFARRFQGLCSWYTPLNEPRINAWYCGHLGWWPPYGRGWKSYVQILTNIARGICLTQRAIADAAPDSVFVHVDASDLYVADNPEDELLVGNAFIRQELVYLTLDLVMGRVDGEHSLRAWLDAKGITDRDLDWFDAHAVTPDIVGFNMYPMFSLKRVLRGRTGNPIVRIKKCWTDELVRIAHHYAARYDPLPVMVTETASSGSLERRIRWIEESTSALLRERERGLNIVGYTFWPLFSLITWAYQKGKKELHEYILHMGLFDLVPTENGLERVETDAVEAFRQAVRRPLSGAVQLGA